MSCCGGEPYTGEIYIPLPQRLVEYGQTTVGLEVMNRFPSTRLWIFSFIQDVEGCSSCVDAFTQMISWFRKRDFLDNPSNNVKFIYEDNILGNPIARDIGIVKSPTHIFCGPDGTIHDIVLGTPNDEWLDQYILPKLVS